MRDIPTPIDPPVATITVPFSRPITGSQIAKLAEKAAGGPSGGFVARVCIYDAADLLSFGQRSSWGYGIRVVPSLDGSPFFWEAKGYSNALVTSHTWDGAEEKGAAGHSRLPIIANVLAFAAKLTAAYEGGLRSGSFPMYIEPVVED